MKRQKILIPVFSLTLVASVISLSAIAAPGGPGGPKGPRGAPTDPAVKISRMFNHLDSDGSGVVTLDEFLAKPADSTARTFARLDGDADSLVSFEEFTARSGRHHHAPRGAGRGEPDSVGDIEAVRACVEAQTGRSAPERPDAETVFADIDTSDDGLLELGEFTGAAVTRATARFNEIDANGDGGITEDEAQAELDAREALREIRHACIEEQRAVEDLLGE